MTAEIGEKVDSAGGLPVTGPAGVALPPLRAWQRRALTKYLSAGPTDFLAVATPGAGKTTFALRVALELLSDRTVDQVTVVAPTEHLKHQWAEAAARVGLALDSRFSNSTGQTSSDFHGIVVTYAQVASHPSRHRVRTENRKTLVILDEIHHGGDAKSWGEGIREAYGDATRRLALTGTPFRSDDSPIPFVNYEPDDEGLPRSRPDHSYGYADALADGVVRPVVFLAYSGEARWRNSAGEEFAARLGEPLSAEQTARAWRTALDPSGEWVPSVLAAANTRLHQLRQGGIPDAGGLVIASDQTTARAYAGILEAATGETPTLVLSDDPGSSARIAEFGAGTSTWMVAVRMVSEGVDVPRLAVGVYATSASTPLYFAQAVGRFVRARKRGETASVFLPSVPVILAHAGTMEVERDHALDRPEPEAGEEQIWSEEEGLLEEANRDEGASDDLLGSFEALESDAHFDHVLYDSKQWGLHADVGSDDEQDYLGLPGLLEPDQVHALLSERQSKQSAKTGRKRPAEPQTVSAHRALASQRKELNSLVSAYATKKSVAHANVHMDLRRACGGPELATATSEQVTERIETIRRWFVGRR